MIGHTDDYRRNLLTLYLFHVCWIPFCKTYKIRTFITPSVQQKYWSHNNILGHGFHRKDCAFLFLTLCAQGKNFFMRIDRSSSVDSGLITFTSSSPSFPSLTDSTRSLNYSRRLFSYYFSKHSTKVRNRLITSNKLTILDPRRTTWISWARETPSGLQTSSPASEGSCQGKSSPQKRKKNSYRVFVLYPVKCIVSRITMSFVRETRVCYKSPVQFSTFFRSPFVHSPFSTLI